MDGPNIDLGQGNTPLVRSRSIGPRAGIADLRFKMEHLNPSGSYKDRFAGFALAQARAAGARSVVATSSGNTGAALACFAAATGLGCTLYVSENAPQGKLDQMLAYGARVWRVDRFTIDAEESRRITQALTRHAAAQGQALLVTAYAISPGPMAGIEGIGRELAVQAPDASDVFVPVGGGGLFVAVARGLASARPGRGPRLHAVQPAGNDTVATPLRQGATVARPVETATTISGLGVGYVLDGDAVIAHARESGGQGHVLDEDHIRAIQARLAHEEGILVEPAGAVAVAGALAAAARGELAGGPVIAVLTGHGFKDPASLRALGAEAGRTDLAGLAATFEGTA